MFCAVAGAAPAAAGTAGASSAYGESVQLNLLPLLGGGVTIGSGPLPTISGSAPPTYDHTASLANAAVTSGLLGNILSTGVLTVRADSSLTTSNESHAHSEVDNPNLGVSSLLTVAATMIVSDAAIGGSCGSTLTAVGSSNLAGVNLGGTLGLGLAVPVNPTPNTVLLNLLGIKIVLNEQTVIGDGVNTKALTVNALHVNLSNTLLSLLGALSGDIVIAHSQASVNCNGAASSADVTLTKTAFPIPGTVGQPLTYTLSASNAGPDAAANVVVTDPLPAGVTFTSATTTAGTCSGTATVVCSLGTLAAGATATITIAVTPTQAGSLTNSASETSTTATPNPGDGSASTTTTVNPAGGGVEFADLSMTAWATPTPAMVGNQLTYSVVVGNTGPDDATGVTVADTLPAGMTLVSETTSQGTCTGGLAMLCNLGTMANGGQATITIVVMPTVAGPAVDLVTVASTITDPSPGNNSATVNTMVDPANAGQADLSITASAAPNPVTVGNPLTYTITVSNTGPDAASAVAVTDALPVGTTFVSATASQGTCTDVLAVECDLGTVAAGAQATVTIVVQPAIPGTLVNVIAAASGTADPSSGNNSVSVSTTVDATTALSQADLSVTATASPSPATVGSQLTYSINVGNAGPDDAPLVTVTDTLPVGFTFVSATASQGSCTGTLIVVCNLGTVASGGQASIAIVAVPSVPGAAANVATVASTAVDPSPGNNSVTVNTTVNSVSDGLQADLSLSVLASPTTVTVGGQLTYTLTVSNAGPSSAASVVVTDILPVGATFVSALAGQGSCTGTGTVICDLGTIAANGTATVTLAVIPVVAGTAVNDSLVASAAVDPNPANNHVSLSTLVKAVTGGVIPDLGITGSDSPDPAIVGDLLTYTLVVANAGPGSANGLVLTTILPNGTTFVSANTGGGSCTGTTTVSCGAVTLAQGATWTVTIVVSLDHDGTMVLNSNIGSDTQDPTPANNSLVMSTVVNPRATGTCTPGANILCIDNKPGDRRFEVKTSYSTVEGGGLSGQGTAVPISSLGIEHGGLFWFFEPYNPEMLVKVVNACSLSQKFWIFYSAGTNVGVVTTVTDTETGLARVYTNSDLHAAPPVQDTNAFDCTAADLAQAAHAASIPRQPSAAPAAAAQTRSAGTQADAGCTNDGTTLCIAGRFQVRVTYETTQSGGKSGSGQAMPLTTLNLDRGGIFWFFDDTNPEMLIKVLDACTLENTYWVFFSATTNVGFTVTVLDTSNGHTAVYHNQDLTAAVPVQDTSALPCS
jgi:uncharacterized repeat protein (TIGR01451 family)